MFKLLKSVVVFVMGFSIGALSITTFSLYSIIKGTDDMFKERTRKRRRRRYYNYADYL